jgi:hypothetical protein
MLELSVVLYDFRFKIILTGILFQAPREQFTNPTRWVTSLSHKKGLSHRTKGLSNKMKRLSLFCLLLLHLEKANTIFFLPAAPSEHLAVISIFSLGAGGVSVLRWVVLCLAEELHAFD